MYICDVYQSLLKFYCQRFSNNATPIFTAQELLTVYLFCGAYQRYFSIKEIHTFTKEYLLSWFPNLPSYQTFNYRLNLMSEAINELVKHLITLSNFLKQGIRVQLLIRIRNRFSNRACPICPLSAHNFPFMFSKNLPCFKGFRSSTCNKQILNRHFSVKLNHHLIIETISLYY